MYEINKLLHRKRFVRDFHTRWFCIRNLTRSLRSLVRLQILHQLVWTELKNNCACVTCDPVGGVGGSSAGKSRLKQQIPNVKSITERWRYFVDFYMTLSELKTLGAFQFFKNSSISPIYCYGLTLSSPVFPRELMTCAVVFQLCHSCENPVRTRFPWSNLYLLYLLVSTRAVIGQFSGPYSPVRPAKI